MDTEITQLKKQNRLLKIGIAIGALFFIFVAADRSNQSNQSKTRFKEIDVERINIVSPEGKRELVISNRKLLPRAVVEGKEAGKDFDRNMPGLIFYNDVGDECGGLIFSGKLDARGNPSSGMHFSMDRFGGDQVLVLAHNEGNGRMETGLKFYDTPLAKDYMHLLEALEKATDESEKNAIRQKIAEAGGGQTPRLFVGKSVDNASAVLLADAKGRPRIIMLVTPEGEPVLHFLGNSGEPIYSLPPKPEEKAK